MKLFITPWVLLSSLLSLPALAAGDAPKEISVAQVRQLITNKLKPFAIYDANYDEIRAKEGTLPGAIKLKSYDQYPLTELPSDKTTTLVFYCYNKQCPASEIAAQRASDAGYQQVNVMKAGIKGWNADKPNPANKSQN